MSSFTSKELRFKFVLSNNAVFEGTGNNTLSVTGLRALVRVKCSGFPAFPECDVQLYGLRQSDMNALTALAYQLEAITRNTLTVDANSGGGWSTIFSGQILSALPDYTNAPDVSMRIQGRVLGFESIAATAATAYTGATDVATIVQNIATRMGKAFENNGVTAQLSNPYFPGTLADQLRAVTQAAGIQLFAEPTDSVIAIAPAGVARRTPVWVLSPATGLVGYPVIESRGYINVRSIFNPAFRFGGPVRVEGSDVPRANGDWQAGTLSHMLDALKPGGNWFSEMLLYPIGTLGPVFG